MASNLLYKTQTSQGSTNDKIEHSNISIGGRSNKDGTNDNNVKSLSLEEEGQFAADFQHQNHRFRWGQGNGKVLP